MERERKLRKKSCCNLDVYSIRIIRIRHFNKKLIIYTLMAPDVQIDERKHHSKLEYKIIYCHTVCSNFVRIVLIQ